MGRKSVNKLMNRDRLAMTAVSRCGFCTKQHLNNYIKDSRIQSYERAGWLKKETIVSNQNIKTTAYKLTGEGKKVLEKNFGVKHHYKEQSINHDLKIADKYFSLSEKERETWRTETEIRHLFNEKLEEIKRNEYDRYEKILEDMRAGLYSMPDCSYTLETEIEVYFEATTSNYSQADYEAKERTITILKEDNTRYETSR